MSKIVKAILVEPEKAPKVIEIANELRALQTAVGGMVEVFYPFENDEPLICYCNEEGKYNGMEPNWVWFDESGLVPRDVVMGPILVCGDAGDGTERSLSRTEIEFVTEFFSRNRCIGDVVKKNKINFSK